MRAAPALAGSDQDQRVESRAVRTFCTRAATLGYAAVIVLAGMVGLSGCGTGAPATGESASPSTTDSAGSLPPGTSPEQARAQLAARAAAAQDRHMVATYKLSSRNSPQRRVSVTLAADGTWRVDIAQGVLGGTADVSMARTGDGLYQCGLPSIDQPSTNQPSMNQATTTGCVRVGRADGHIDGKYDPRVQHAFTDWLAVLTDQKAALAVSTARAANGIRGACFSVESSSVSLVAPLDLGVYCFDQDGTLTAATLGFGSLVLDGTPGPAPASVSLPAPVVDGDPLPTASPPRSPSP